MKPRQEKTGSGEKDTRSGFGLASFSIRYPVTICMVFVSIIVLGLISVVKIPLILFPEFNQPFLSIRVPYRNATPGQIQESITKPLEEVLSTVPGVQRMSSGSSSDSCWVQLFFDLGVDIDVIRAEVREKVEQIRVDLPEDVESIRIQNWGTEDIPIIWARIASRRDLRTASDFLEMKIKKPLERVEGVAEVNLWGTQRKEIDVYLRLDDLKRYGVDVGQLFRQLDDINTSRSLGRVVDGDTRYGAISRGTITSLQQIRSLPVNERGLKLEEVADVNYGHPVATNGQHLNGEYAVGFEVLKTSQANTVETVERVLAKVEEMRLDPGLEGIDLLVWRNAGEQITKSLRGLLSAGAFGAILAALVLFLFLHRLGATLIVALSIPFSLISAVGFLYLLGNTLNVLTMMGLMLATGMLVDNAVVVLESIYQKLENGMDHLEASRIGTGEVNMAVIAATLTSIIIFVPLIFGQDTSFSVFLGHVGVAVVLALLSSLFISLTLIPLAMARLLRMDVREPVRWQQRLKRGIAVLLSSVGRLFPDTRNHPKGSISEERAAQGGIVGTYLKLVDWPLQHRFLVGLVLVPSIVYGSGWFLVNRIPDNSPGAEELGSLEIQYEFSENYHYAKIEMDFVLPVEEFLFQNREEFKIEDVFSRFYNDRASTEIYFSRDELDLEELDAIRGKISTGLPVVPGAEIRLGRQQGAQSQNWIMASIYGDSPEVLQELAAQARRILLDRPDFTEVYTALRNAQEEVQIRLDRQLAVKYGISPQSVSEVLAIVLRGRQVRGYRTQEGEVDIFVWLTPRDRDSLEDLRSVAVGRGRDGQEILLSHVADLRVEKIPAQLRRENRRTFTELSAVYTGDRRNEGMQRVEEVMNGISYPPGYGWSYGFWTERSQQEDREFLFNILLALFMVYFVMASLFESVAHPFAIMFSLPFAVVGISVFLFMTGTPFNMMAKIGILVLIGIVVNNGIVLIDHINNLRRAGMTRTTAIREGCRERFRPIVMTASTTIVGLLPLAFSHSSLFDMRYFPMARTVMGGLMASTILTLVVLPTYYTLFDDLAIWVKHTWYTSDPSKQATLTSAPSSD